MKLPSHHGRIDTDVAMTPMIDVVFQLMIFFICTASFQLAEETLPMSLAASAITGDTAPRELEENSEQLIVAATRVGDFTQWVVNDRPCQSLDEVQQILQTAAGSDKSRQAVLDIASGVPLGDMIDAYDRCRVVGFERIQVAVEAANVKE